MKKIGILLIFIMLFSMIGVFDTVLAGTQTDNPYSDTFSDQVADDWEYNGFTTTSKTEIFYQVDENGTYGFGGHVKFSKWSTISMRMTSELYIRNSKLNPSVYSGGTFIFEMNTYYDGKWRDIVLYLRKFSDQDYCRIGVFVNGQGGHYDPVDVHYNEDLGNAFVYLGSVTLEVNKDTGVATVSGLVDQSLSLTAGSWTQSGGYVTYYGNGSTWVTTAVTIQEGLTKDFTSVEITSDKTHYDMTDTQAIFTVTVADADGPVTGCTIDETITLPDATTDTSLTWTDNGDGTYTSSPLTLNQYGMYQYECTVSKEGYNDGSDSGVFTRDKGPYQIIIQTNKPRYTRADTDIGTTVIVSDGNGDPVTGCTITGEITKYDGTTLASWSDWTNPREGYYQHTVSIADLGVTGDNVECSFSAEVTIPEYDTVETGSVSFTLNYESGGGGDDENNGSISLSLSNTNINYDSTTWSYSSTLIATVTDENGPLSGAQIDISTSPNGEGASPLVVSPSSGETGGDGTFSASISCNAFDAVNGYTATVTASYGGDSVTETIQITTEETGGDNDNGGGGGGYEAPDSDSSGNDANSPPNPHETPDDSPDDEGPNHIYIYCFDTQTYQESYEYRVGQEIYVGVKYTDSQGNLIHNATVMITHEGPTTEETESRILPSDLNYEYFECFDTSNWVPDKDHYIKVSAIDPRSGQIDKGSIKLKIS
ncbi:MAG: Ig-like domain-containing protein, partial [Methanomicrobia archaeon]|nr:Ig-like domain-containing protein [Methanomicrobia archaeon]